MKKSPAARRYYLRTFLASIAYVIAVFVSLHLLWHGKVPMPAAIGLACIPSIPLVAIIAIVGLYLKEETDEFQRELYIKSLLWSAAGTLALTSFWSFLHLFAHVAAVDGFHVFLMFWVFVAISSFSLSKYYGGSSE
jgi:hypothetical protein